MDFADSKVARPRWAGPLQLLRWLVVQCFKRPRHRSGWWRQPLEASTIGGILLRPLVLRFFRPMNHDAASEPDTSASLLDRLGNPGNREANEDWNRFVDLYAPLIYRWGQQRRLQPPDVQDLVQEVMVSLHQLLPTFRYDPQQRFRGYLRGITTRVLSQRQRRRQPGQADQATLHELVDDNPVHRPDYFEQREYDAYVSRRSLELIREQFPDQQWRACWLTIVEGQSIASVCQELQMTANMVYLARSRVLAVLRRELRHLLG